MIQGINHLTFEVRDLPRSVRFYQDVLGARLTALGERQAYLDVEGLWIALNVGEAHVPPSPTYDHVAFTVNSEDLERMRQRLQATGWPAVADRDRDPAEAPSLYVRDPDGHLLEFHAGSHQQRLRYLRTAGLPIRVFDDVRPREGRRYRHAEKR